MSTSNLPVLDSLVERIVDRAGLRGGQRDRVARELHAHLADAIDDGRSIEQVAADFGDPELVASLIRRNPPDRGLRARHTAFRVAATAATIASVVFGVTYALTASRLETFRRPQTSNAWLDTLASIARMRQNVSATVRANGETATALAAIDDAVASAILLAQHGDAFGQAVAAQLSTVALDAGTSLAANRSLTESERRRLSHCLRALRSNQIALDSSVEQHWIADIARRSFDDRDRPSARSLDVAKAMKGVRESTMRARLLEPVFFAGTESARRRWAAMVSSHFAEARRAQSRFRATYASTLASIETPLPSK